MDPSEKMRLNSRKESCTLPTASSECTTPESKLGDETLEKTYPFALVLRLRVLQIVCGISAMVMGTVAFIEERGSLNLGLGIPAGAATVIAAAASIHTSRGFGGYRPASCTRDSPWASLRFLGPSAHVAVPLALLWLCACGLHGALLVQATRTLLTHGGPGANLPVLAGVQLCLAGATLAVVVVLLRVDCRYDPD